MSIEILDQLFFSGRLVTGEDNCEEAPRQRDKNKQEEAQKNDCRLLEAEPTPNYAAAPTGLAMQ